MNTKSQTEYLEAMASVGAAGRDAALKLLKKLDERIEQLTAPDEEFEEALDVYRDINSTANAEYIDRARQRVLAKYNEAKAAAQSGKNKGCDVCYGMSCPHCLQCFPELKEGILEIEEEHKRLREALNKFGRHDKHCALYLDNPEVLPRRCDCGFEKALKGKAVYKQAEKERGK